MYHPYPAAATPSRTLSSSTSSSRSSSWTSSQTSRTPGDVPSCVRDLLMSTKRLRETLSQWSIRRATESQVSDVFVETATEFNTTIHAFNYHRIDLTEIHSFPKDLRAILESCLAEDPSPQVLEVYMPQVRQVLYKLLKALQARQEAWRAIGGRMPMIPPESF